MHLANISGSDKNPTWSRSDNTLFKQRFTKAKRPESNRKFNEYTNVYDSVTMFGKQQIRSYFNNKIYMHNRECKGPAKMQKYQFICMMSVDGPKKKITRQNANLQNVTF